MQVLNSALFSSANAKWSFLIVGVYKSKKEGKDQEWIQSSTTPDPGYQWESDITLDITNESQEVSPFPAGDHKASTNRQAWKHNKTRQI